MNPVALGWLLLASQIVFCLTALVVFVQAVKFAPKARHFAAAALLFAVVVASCCDQNAIAGLPTRPHIGPGHWPSTLPPAVPAMARNKLSC